MYERKRANMALLRAVVRLAVLAGPPAVATAVIGCLYQLRIASDAFVFFVALMLWIEAVRALNRD